MMERNEILTKYRVKKNLVLQGGTLAIVTEVLEQLKSGCVQRPALTIPWDNRPLLCKKQIICPWYVLILNKPLFKIVIMHIHTNA